MKTTLMAVMICAVMFAFSCSAIAEEMDAGGCEKCHQDIVDNFSTSLHHTATGMYDGYETGAAGHFNIEVGEYYEQWKCAKCHATTCTTCHPGQNMYESHLYEVTIETCEPCHGKKQASTYMGDMPMHKSQGPNADVHYEAGLDCTDCHPASEIHGTGIKYDTQLEATNVECEGCHKDVTESRAHTVHDGKLDCVSCHTGWILTCNGCHIDTRKGMTVTADEFLLGLDKDEKVTTFMKMNVTLGNESHLGYGYWYAHTTTATGKDCVFCHENPDVLGQGLEGQILADGGSLLSQETIDRVLTADLTEGEKRSYWGDLFARLLNW